MGASGHVQVHATQIERTLECTLSRSPTGSPAAAAACPHVARRQNRSTDTGPNRLFDYTTFLFLFFLFYACSWLSQDEPTKIRLPLRCQTLSREDVSINLSKETRTRRFCSNFEFWNCFNTALDTFLFQLSSYTFFKNYLIN